MYGTLRNHEMTLCVRSKAPVPDELDRDYHCDALNRSLTQFSRRTRRAINKMLAPLSEAEDIAACEAICFSITTDAPCLTSWGARTTNARWTASCTALLRITLVTRQRSQRC
jgi:hypothetical protein